MTTLKIDCPIRKNWTSHGNYLKGIVEVAGEPFRIEADLDKTWLNIIDDNSRQESCVIEDGCIISKSGEWVTEKWTDADWDALNRYVAQVNS